MSEQVVAYFDGLCEPNPDGFSCGGFVIEPCSVFHDGLIGGRFFGHGSGNTNITSDYKAALLVLTTLHGAGYKGQVLLKGDSQIVQRQFSGEDRCGAPKLVPLLAELKQFASLFERVAITWIPKPENQRADDESNRIYTVTTGKSVPVRGKNRK